MNFNRHTLLLSTMLIASATAFSASTAHAQDSDSEEIVVTGSRISSANIIASSPVTTINSDTFERIGAIDAVDVLNRLPSVTAAQDSNVSNGATGTSSLNLRGLGTTRNLILIDGKRLGPGRPNIASADLNQVPTPLLERVEVVTGGASAAYGSDAIAGVANFILRRDFEGFELNTNYGFFLDSNDNDFAQDVTDLSSTDGVTPDRTELDGQTIDISAVFGTNFAEDRGNVTGYVRYVEQKSVLQGDRDVSRCAIVDFGPVAGDDVFCVGSNFGPNPTTVSLPTILERDAAGAPVQFLADEDGEFIDATGAIVDRFSAILAPAGSEFTRARQLGGTTAGTVSLDASGNFTLGADNNGQGATNAFNFNPTNFFQRPTERIQGGFLANYEINNNAEVYLDASFFRNTTDAQIAPSATFGEIQSINCDNPFLTPELLEAICTNNGFGGTDLAPVQINRRFVEAGGRNSFIELDNLRLVGGVRGEIADSGFDYDVFGQYSTTSQTDTNSNDGDIDLLTEALLVRTNPTTGELECTSGRAACQPLNLLGTSAVDTVALNAILTPTILSGETKQLVLGATVQGELEGLKSPGADSGVAILAGVEYREDQLRGQPDSILIRGGSTGLGGPSRPTDASAEVTEFFAEVGIPLLEDQPFAQNLSATAQYRYSDYDYVNNLPGAEEADGVSTEAYSAGLSWTPVSDLRLRGQYQRSVRAPNVFELFLPQGIALFNDSDPCSGTVGSANLSATSVECARTGLDTALFGAVTEDAGQLNQLTGGNLALEPETSDTFTIGAVLRPSFAEGLVVSVDYFDITVDDFITAIPPNSVLDGCLNGSQPQFCEFINRDANGSLQNDGFISAVSQNVAERVSRGFDINASYNFDLDDTPVGNHGNIGLNYVTTIFTALEQTSFPGAPIDNCRGEFGGSCFTGDITPKYGHNASLTWDTNHDVDVTLTWRHIGEVTSQLDVDGVPEIPEGAIGNIFEAENYIDLFAKWDAAESLSFNVGINNALDNDPPISDFRFTANGNTFPSTYDSAGRYIFVGAKIKL